MRGPEVRADCPVVSRTVHLVLASVSAFFLLFPLTLGKPGLPPHLKADEAAYYLAALSLAHDHDLRVEPKDVERAFQEFPYGPVNNMIVMTDDGWRTVYFGKPYLYSFFAAPFAWKLGANGLVFFNMLMTLAMVWMGYLYLRRYNPPGLAALFAAAFFLLSVGFSYVFWIQPEVFNMFSVAACLFFGLPRGDETGLPDRRRELLLGGDLSGPRWRSPSTTSRCSPPWGSRRSGPIARDRRWRTAGVWIAGGRARHGRRRRRRRRAHGPPSAYLGVQPAGGDALRAGQGAAEVDARGYCGSGGSGDSRPERRRRLQPRRPAVQAVPNSTTGQHLDWLFRQAGRHPLRAGREHRLLPGGAPHGDADLYPVRRPSALLFFLLARPGAAHGGALAAAGGARRRGALLPDSSPGTGRGAAASSATATSSRRSRRSSSWSPRSGRAAPPAGVRRGRHSSWRRCSSRRSGRRCPSPRCRRTCADLPFRFLPLELSLRNVPGYERVPLGDFADRGAAGRLRRRWASRCGWAAPTRVELYFIGEHPMPKAVFQVTNLAPEQPHRDPDGHGQRQVLDFGGEGARRVELRSRRSRSGCGGRSAPRSGSTAWW